VKVTGVVDRVLPAAGETSWGLTRYETFAAQALAAAGSNIWMALAVGKSGDNV
jgi:hypothetical protein